MSKLSNEDIIWIIIKKVGVENPSQLSVYLSKKYGVHLTSSNMGQFIRSESETITRLLLREALEDE